MPQGRDYTPCRHGLQHSEGAGGATEPEHKLIVVPSRRTASFGLSGTLVPKCVKWQARMWLPPLCHQVQKNVRGCFGRVTQQVGSLVLRGGSIGHQGAFFRWQDVHFQIKPALRLWMSFSRPSDFKPLKSINPTYFKMVSGDELDEHADAAFFS